MAEYLQPQIQGDPMVALVAQLNRFRTRQKLTQPLPELPLVAGPITNEIAIEAITLLQARALSAIEDPLAAASANELTIALRQPIQYVAPRVSSIAQMLALFGDSLGLPPAKAGITRADPRFVKTWDVWMWASVLGSVGLASILVAFGARRLRARAA